MSCSVSTISLQSSSTAQARHTSSIPPQLSFLPLIPYSFEMTPPWKDPVRPVRSFRSRASNLFARACVLTNLDAQVTIRVAQHGKVFIFNTHPDLQTDWNDTRARHLGPRDLEFDESVIFQEVSSPASPPPAGLFELRPPTIQADAPSMTSQTESNRVLKSSGQAE